MARLRVLLALALSGMLVVPVALAMACGPQAGVFPNLTGRAYAPGESGTITGVNFQPGLSFSIMIENGPTLATVTVPDSQTFTVSFTAPSTPGTYVIVAVGTDSQGLALRSSPGTLVVAIPQAPPAATADATPPATQAPAAADAPASEAAPAPAARAPVTAAPAKKPAAAKQPAGRPAVTAAPGRTRTPAARSPRPAAQPAPVADQSPAQPAPAVFAGSVPRRTSDAATPRKKAAATARLEAPRAAAPSQSSIVADAWSGLDAGSEPALVPSGRYPVSDTGSNGTAATLSILMLGLGLAGLIGSLGVGELRRRRSRVR